MKLNIFEIAAIASMMAVAVVTAISVIFGSDRSDPIDGRIQIFDRGQERYLNGRDPKDRASLIWVADQLATDLSQGKVTDEQALAIESRLDSLLRTTGRYNITDAEYDRLFRIEQVLTTRQAQRAQIDAIVSKRCGAISAASANPEGTVTTGPVEIVCP